MKKKKKFRNTLLVL